MFVLVGVCVCSLGLFARLLVRIQMTSNIIYMCVFVRARASFLYFMSHAMRSMMQWRHSTHRCRFYPKCIPRYAFNWSANDIDFHGLMKWLRIVFTWCCSLLLLPMLMLFHIFFFTLFVSWYYILWSVIFDFVNTMFAKLAIYHMRFILLGGKLNKEHVLCDKNKHCCCVAISS